MHCISQGQDFGTAYAYLRPQWHLDFFTLEARMTYTEAEDARERAEALDPSNNHVVNAKLRPRRVWDLFSNRVLLNGVETESVLRLVVVPVSHVWLAENERTEVHTPINSFQWPVPLPVDSSLERVRIELLNLGLQYVWLDVLCLRQRGNPEAEPQRAHEWKLDVRTIGAVHRETG
ncbi:hypothetical protein FB45DRAFT_756613 [Roridomyces roridus]|uniref:Heterokaryon incompatibility domain-containing protein n=1 Tax=Roridomyces roridus TaxID=1738132 RepID=A0AAD7FDA6_9AGAR|nr:hypothetical protein FB45DRAFT_756613 [Roridomyces roridus]